MNDSLEFFEGDEITGLTAQIPTVKLEAPEAYPRGTYLTLQLQVRVRSVRLDEDRKGNLTRHHVLALEDCTIGEVVTPAQRKALADAAERALAQESAQGVQQKVIHEEPSIEDMPQSMNEWSDEPDIEESDDEPDVDTDVARATEAELEVIGF